MDSGSSLHSARNDEPSPVIPAKAGIQSPAWIPGLRYTQPGMTERGRCRSPPSFPRKRESRFPVWIPGHRCTQPGMTERGRCCSPPSFPRKRESRFTVWIPGHRCAQPGMTERGRCRSPPSFPRKRGITPNEVANASAGRDAHAIGKEDFFSTLPIWRGFHARITSCQKSLA